MHSMSVLVLCLIVIDCDVSDWLDLPELTSIQLGDSAFRNTPSLELKSILIHNEWQLDMPSLKSLLFGREAFYQCSRVVFESDWLWCDWLNRLAWIDFHSIGLWYILQNTIIGVEEYSHSQWVMTRHAFSQIGHAWRRVIHWLFSCSVWEWLIVMWVIE